MEYINLNGSDDVRAAASVMQSAANEMKNAAYIIQESLQKHEAFMQTWLYDLQQMLERPRSDRV